MEGKERKKRKVRERGNDTARDEGEEVKIIEVMNERKGKKEERKNKMT